MVGYKCSLVRELHVYGDAVGVSDRDPTKFQHQGYGMLLMEEAERIAREEVRRPENQQPTTNNQH